MAIESLVATLKTLKCYGMAAAVTELDEQQSPAYRDAVPVLETLLKAEVAERDVRSINYQMKVAKFPAYRDLAGFNFADSTVDESLVKALHQGEFIGNRIMRCSLAGRVRAKPIWPPPLASKPFNTFAFGYAASQR